jgi:hypothetical protein
MLFDRPKVKSLLTRLAAKAGIVARFAAVLIPLPAGHAEGIAEPVNDLWLRTELDGRYQRLDVGRTDDFLPAVTADDFNLNSQCSVRHSLNGCHFNP